MLAMVATLARSSTQLPTRAEVFLDEADAAAAPLVQMQFSQRVTDFLASDTAHSGDALTLGTANLHSTERGVNNDV